MTMPNEAGILFFEKRAEVKVLRQMAVGVQSQVEPACFKVGESLGAPRRNFQSNARRERGECLNQGRQHYRCAMICRCNSYRELGAGGFENLLREQGGNSLQSFGHRRLK